MVYFPCLDGTTRKILSCRKCICGRCRWLDNLGVDQISTKLACQCVWTKKKHGNLTINSSNSDSGRTCRNRAGFSPFFQPSEICPTPKLHDSAERSKDEISYRAVPGRWILWEWRRVCYMVIYGYIWLMFDNYGLTVCYWKWTMDYGYIIGYYNYGLWVVYSIWLMFDKLWFMATITIVTLW
jgi:hypothetical protein